jgi:hypothetical protein
LDRSEAAGLLENVDNTQLVIENICRDSLKIPMTPFVLKGCTKLPAEPEPHGDHIFDRCLQVWVNRKSGLPVVVEMQTKQSQFGETILTKTTEGVDQSEISGLEASQFGETRVTRSEAEGADRIDFGGLSQSVFGEDTRKTVAPEPADTSDFNDELMSQFGETSLTETHEGADQPDMLLTASDQDTPPSVLQ